MGSAWDNYEPKSKPTTIENPKDIVGCKKVPYSCVPSQVVAELAVAMFEGALKYGRHNYRDAGVSFTIYADAAKRHIDAITEGQDIDPDSGLNHIIKAIASLTVLRDGMLNDFWVDDRPPKVKNPNWMGDLNKKVEGMLEKIPVEKRKAPFLEKKV